MVVSDFVLDEYSGRYRITVTLGICKCSETKRGGLGEGFMKGSEVGDGT